jgi:hypothetical protein
MIIDAVYGCFQTKLKDLLGTAPVMWEFEFKADLVTTSVTQFHILAINYCTPFNEQPLTIAIKFLRHQNSNDVMQNKPRKKVKSTRQPMYA